MSTPTQLRSDVAVLTDVAAKELTPLWAAESALAVEAALRDLLPALVDQYGSAAAVVASDWYDDLRAAREIRSPFRAIPADIAETGTQALVGWALTEATDLPAFQTLIEGGTQRRIANFARQTVMASSIADPRAQGWMRVGSGQSCPFCSMLLGRGGVYTESSVEFQAHDHDDCGAAPAWT